VTGFAEILRSLLTNDAQLLAMRQAAWDKAAEFDLVKIAGEYETVLDEARAMRRIRVSHR
jgi:hypothetical protein